jgi:uroporphyrinogen-III synthase
MGNKIKNNALYLGLNPANYKSSYNIHHLPIIETFLLDLHSKEFDEMWKSIDSFTHVLFTSKTTVNIVLNTFSIGSLKNKTIICIGRQTQKAFSKSGLESWVCIEETQEGVIEVLKGIESLNILYLHSKNARPLIKVYLKENNIDHFEKACYETKTKILTNLPSLDLYEAIIFTSPSTVDGFLDNFGFLPKDKKLFSQGRITEEYLIEKQKLNTHTQ